jgi:type IV secretory pathway VirB10-like protein
MDSSTLSTDQSSHCARQLDGSCPQHRRIVGHPIVFVALIAVILTGCGSSKPPEPATAAAQTETRSIEALRKKDEAETYSPREIKEREQANRYASAHASEYAQQHQQEEQQQEGQEEAAERAKEEQQESAPGSHHYPSAVRAGFLHGCESSTGHEVSACKCALRRIEAKVPLGRYHENEHEIDEGRPLPLIYSVEYGYCVGSEAAKN